MHDHQFWNQKNRIVNGTCSKSKYIHCYDSKDKSNVISFFVASAEPFRSVSAHSICWMLNIYGCSKYQKLWGFFFLFSFPQFYYLFIVVVWMLFMIFVITISKSSMKKKKYQNLDITNHTVMYGMDVAYVCYVCVCVQRCYWLQWSVAKDYPIQWQWLKTNKRGREWKEVCVHFTTAQQNNIQRLNLLSCLR